ncbi:MAG: HEAT repeat domain-containing protein [Pseudomarimonas sp.]
MHISRLTLAASLCGLLLGFASPNLQAAPSAQSGSPAAEASQAVYWKGHEALEKGDWNAAIRHFKALEKQLAASTTEPADAAMYWQAYALSQAGRNKEAASEVARLRQAYPNSAWLDDAAALAQTKSDEAGSKKARKDAVDGRDADALMALDALLVGGSERGVPLLLRVLSGNHSDHVKSRAMFVLSQLDASAADAALDGILAGDASPQLKQEAVRMIAVGGRKESLDRLLPLYRSSNDAAIKTAVMEAFLIGGRGDLVQALFESETNPELRLNALNSLGAMGEGDRLKALYGPQLPREERRQLLHAYGVAGELQALIDVARSETDPELQVEAIRSIGIGGDRQAGATLVELYRPDASEQVRRAVIEGLMIANDSEAMLQLYRKETDPELRRQLLHSITAADPDAAIELIDAALKP